MIRHILFIIDEVEFKYFEFNDLVTNFWIIKELLERDFQVSVSTKNNLFIENSCGMSIVQEAFLDKGNIFYRKAQSKKAISSFDVVFFRPDPPVDIDYINACGVFDFVDTEKTLVINNPSAVKNFNEKLHLNYFPQYAPKNIVSSSKDILKEFVKAHGEAIIKPLNRCFGSGVYYLNANDKNLNSIITTATDNQKTAVMAQEYLSKAEFGDKRILILGEEVFDECIMKLPGEDDFKFNAHKDQFFAGTKISQYEKNMAMEIAKNLGKVGLYMVGLDVIDEKIIEINVTSPCYFIKEINTNYGIKFQDKLMDSLLGLIEEKHGSKECFVCKI